MSDMKYADLLPRHIPSELYRVDYPGSRTVYHAGDGLKAADPSTDFIDKPLSALKAAVTNSFTWQCREPSSFINLFTDRKHAESWALTEPWHKTRTLTWRLFVIDANKLPTLDLLSLRDLVEKLNVKIPEAAGQHREGAFICLHRIPQSPIRETVTAREIITQRSYEREQRLDLGIESGDDTDEREMLEENWNTIHFKDLEDNWSSCWER